MKNIFYYDTKLGKIAVAEQADEITDLFFLKTSFDSSKFKLNETSILKEAHRQLQEYLDGKLKTFSLPLKIEGSEFQKKVYNALLKINYGETRSYKEVGRMIGDENSSRAVGNANNKNPIAIFVPCHRVVGSNGDLVGYAGGLDLKNKLLNLEKTGLI